MLFDLQHRAVPEVFVNLLLLGTDGDESKWKSAREVRSAQFVGDGFERGAGGEARNDLSATVQFVALREAPIQDGEGDASLVHGDPRSAAGLNRVECLLAATLICGRGDGGRTRIPVIAIHGQLKATRLRNES